MPLVPRELPDELAAGRPSWLTAGAIRFGLLCLLIVLIEMLRPRLTPHAAGVVALLGFVLLAAVAAVFAGAARRLSARLTFLSASQRAADAVLLELRRVGLPLIGAVFFLAWTFVYLALWWYDPAGAFGGLGVRPRFADFFYYSVTTALISPPGDIVAQTRGARAATMIEMLAGVALLTAYVSSFVDWAPRPEPPPDG
jgi:hypothetical protein